MPVALPGLEEICLLLSRHLPSKQGDGGLPDDLSASRNGCQYEDHKAQYRHDHRVFPHKRQGHTIKYKLPGKDMQDKIFHDHHAADTANQDPQERTQDIIGQIVAENLPCLKSQSLLRSDDRPLVIDHFDHSCIADHNGHQQEDQGKGITQCEQSVYDDLDGTDIAHIVSARYHPILEEDPVRILFRFLQPAFRICYLIPGVPQFCLAVGYLCLGLCDFFQALLIGCDRVV